MYGSTVQVYGFSATVINVMLLKLKKGVIRHASRRNPIHPALGHNAHCRMPVVCVPEIQISKQRNTGVLGYIEMRIGRV